MILKIIKVLALIILSTAWIVLLFVHFGSGSIVGNLEIAILGPTGTAVSILVCAICSALLLGGELDMYRFSTIKELEALNKELEVKIDAYDAYEVYLHRYFKTFKLLALEKHYLAPADVRKRMDIIYGEMNHIGK